MMRWQKQVFIHTRLSRAYLALARLSCISPFATGSRLTYLQLKKYCPPKGEPWRLEKNK